MLFLQGTTRYDMIFVFLSLYLVALARCGAELICETDECHELGKRIKNSMDEGAGACDNFYKFVCGKYIDSATIPDDKSYVNTFVEMQEKLESQLKPILESESKSDEIKPYRDVKHMFKMCMDEEKMNRRGVEPMKALINGAGGWPVIGTWKKEKWSILDTEISLYKSGLTPGSFFEISVDVDLKDNTKRVITIDQPEVEHEYLKEDTIKESEKFMASVAMAFGAKEETAKSEMKDVLNFVLELEKLTEDRDGDIKYETTYKEFKLSELKKEIGWFDWSGLLTKIVPESVKITEDERIVVFSLDYLKKIGELIKKYEKDGKNHVIANYMIWCAIEDFTDDLTKSLRESTFEVSKIETGFEERPSRWKECFDEIYSRFPLAISSMYVKHFFNDDSKDAVSTMITKLRQVVIERVKSFKWLKPETREKAIKKAMYLMAHVGYPDELLHDDKLIEYHGNLNLHSEHYLESLLNWEKWSNDIEFLLLREEYNKRDWRLHGSVAETEENFDFSENSMDLPAGLLQPPLFGNQVPQYANYARVGQIAGSIFTQAFLSRGSQFDEVGKLNVWWDENSKELFEVKENCFKDQYTAFLSSNNKEMTSGEDVVSMYMGDSAGLSLAYDTYKGLVSSKTTEEAKLPGLEKYSIDQQFFIASANAFCTNMGEGGLDDWIEADEAAPPEFRVNGAVMNSGDFSKAFNCKKSDKLNPEKKCTLW